MSDRPRWGRRPATAALLTAGMTAAGITAAAITAAAITAAGITAAGAALEACPSGAEATLLAAPPSTLEFRPGEIPVLHALAGEAADGEASGTARGEATTGTPATVAVSYQDFPPEAVAAFEAATAVWEERLASPVTITVEARFEDLPDDVLGGAAPSLFVRDPARSTPWYPLALADALTGSDLVPQRPDIVARFNADPSLWYFGTDGRPPADRFDFTTVVLHELSHGLGLIGGFSVGEEGRAMWGSSPQDRSPTVFDTFVSNEGGRLVDTVPNNSTDLAAALTGGDLSFDGPEARQAADGAAPRLYAPSTWEQGTSAYHLDRDGLAERGRDRLIGPALPPGLAIHQPGPILTGVFLDLGWTVRAGGPALDEAAADSPQETTLPAPEPTAPSEEALAETQDEAAAPATAAAPPTAAAAVPPPAVPAAPDPAEVTTVTRLLPPPASPDEAPAARATPPPHGCDELPADDAGAPAVDEIAAPAPTPIQRPAPPVAIARNALALTGEPSRLPLLLGGAFLLAAGECLRRQADRRWRR